MQTEKFQPEDNRVMSETRFTAFSAQSVDRRVEISRSAADTDVGLYFLPMTFKITIIIRHFFHF